jgi:arsenite methyltransferase
MRPSDAMPQTSTISSTRDSPALAASYDEVSNQQFEQGKLLIAALRVADGERVLDIGAGTGRLAAHVAGIVGPRGRVVAIDPLPLRIEIARSKAVANLDTGLGRAEDLSEFPDATFDVVYLNAVFHWVEDKPRALAEVFRVLRPGGRLGLNCQDLDRPHELRVLLRRAIAEAGLELDQDAVYPARAVSDAELDRLVADAGFCECKPERRTFVDLFADVDAVVTWASSSTFGNFLRDVSSPDRKRVLGSLARLLESRRGPDGIRLERYLTFATARKPL